MMTPQRLRELLSYDPGTGVFVWRVDQGRVKSGAAAGDINTTGYRIIMIDGHNYRAGRLAWAISTGAWPTVLIDHKDRDRSNDRLSNLREATFKQNAENMRRPTGRTGVTWNKRRQQWQAKICHNYKQKHLGWFSTEDAGIIARQHAEQKLFTHAGS